MSNKTINPTPEVNIEQRLEELKKIPARNPLQVSSGRARFLNEAAEYRLTLSPGAQARPNGWVFGLRNKKLAVNALVTLILAASLLLGSGATVVAAQNDLPNQPLYQLKLWTEDADLVIHNDPKEQADLLLSMTQTRVQEMAALAEQGIAPPDQVRERLQDQLDQVLGLAAMMDAPAREQILLQLRDRLQSQDQIMEKIQAKTDANTGPQFTQARETLQSHLQLVNEGLTDPDEFRHLMQNQKQNGKDKEMGPKTDQQGEPSLHQNDQNGKPENAPGTGNNNAGGNHNPDHPQNGNGNGGSGNGVPGGPNSGQGNGNGPGGGGGNK